MENSYQEYFDTEFAKYLAEEGDSMSGYDDSYCDNSAGDARNDVERTNYERSRDAHTPGPWEVWDAVEHNTAKLHVGIVSAQGNHIRVASLPNMSAIGEDHANARLIAAAPDLLEALEYAQQIISTARRYFPKSIQNSDTFQLENVNATIGKAIRKAKGE